MNLKLGLIGWLLATGAMSGCAIETASTVPDEDDSATGAVASAIGAALSSSSSSGAHAQYAPRAKRSLLDELIPNAYAATSCPTFKTSGGNCAVSSSTMLLTYDACSFGGSTTWTGVQALTMSTGTAVCGTFPNPGASGTLSRQVRDPSAQTNPGTMTVTTVNGVRVKVDHATTNLKNFDGATIFQTIGSGYGVRVGFDSTGARNSISIAQRVYVDGLLGFDHSVSGQLAVTEESATATSRTVSGSVTVYYNKVKVVGTSVLSNVVHSNTCCMPESGSITTTFKAGDSVEPTTVGAALVGKTETLTFTSCGKATLTKAGATSVDVSLSRCM